MAQNIPFQIIKYLMFNYHEIKAIKEQVLNVKVDNLENYLKKKEGRESRDYMDEIHELVYIDEIQELFQLISTLDFSIKEMKKSSKKLLHIVTLSKNSPRKKVEKKKRAAERPD